MEGTPEAEAEPEPEGEPQQKAESASEPEAQAEVSPDWEAAYEVWGATWPLHVYVFAICFLSIALLSSFLLTLLCFYRPNSLYFKRTATLCLMLMVFGTTRAFRLAVDPYSTKKRINVLVAKLIWSCGFPCLTVSYNVVINVVKNSLIAMDQADIAAPSIKKILLMTALHFTLAFMTEMITHFQPRVSYLVTICQLYFILFGFYLTVSYAYVGYKTRKLSDYTWMRIRIAIAAINATFLSIVHIASITRTYAFYSPGETMDPWEWWCLQTGLRTIEVIASAVILSLLLGTNSGCQLMTVARNLIRKQSSRKISPSKEMQKKSNYMTEVCD